MSYLSFFKIYDLKKMSLKSFESSILDLRNYDESDILSPPSPLLHHPHQQSFFILFFFPQEGTPHILRFDF
jgi:hypothetical protein